MDEVERIAGIAKRVMLKTGYHAPMVFVIGTNDKLIIEMETFGDSNGQRVRDMYDCGTWAALEHNLGNLDLIILVNETWMNSNPDVRPSQDPKRKEMLVIQSRKARTQDEDVQGFEVIRDPKGQVVNLIDWHLPASSSVKGNLLQAFQRGYEMVKPVLN